MIFRLVILAPLAIIAILVASYVRISNSYFDVDMNKVGQAGFIEKMVVIKGYETNYAEGPDNGPPLLLIHGLGSDWQDYAKVLPKLSESHHVFAIDVYGHGKSARLPARAYTNAHIGSLIATFIEETIKAPVVISGHSGGGLLTTWIAAYHPELVKGIILEDPPYFSSVMPRATKTLGGAIAKVTHEFLSQNEEKDFQRYFIKHSGYFAFFGRLENFLVKYSLQYINRNPGKPLEIFFLPPIVNTFFRSMYRFDPVFGASFYDNTWYEGFDTETALAAIQCPAILIHHIYTYHRTGSCYNKEDILIAAMDDEDAAKAKSLIKDVTYIPVSSGHNFHFPKPDTFARIVKEFTSRL